MTQSINERVIKLRLMWSGYVKWMLDSRIAREWMVKISHVKRPAGRSWTWWIEFSGWGILHGQTEMENACLKTKDGYGWWWNSTWVAHVVTRSTVVHSQLYYAKSPLLLGQNTKACLICQLVKYQGESMLKHTHTCAHTHTHHNLF